jgi:hypothetical protein
MYKKILKNIKTAIAVKKQAMNDLYKSENNSVKDRKPHFIFSAENPMYPENIRYKMSHKDVVDLLQRKGYKTEEVDGMYGKPEKSIIVHNPSQLAAKHLLDLSKDLGQESSIYSDGYSHEMHFHGGKNAGLHAKGQGTAFHKRPPDDYYSTMADGTHFTHQINFEALHEPKDSMLKQKTSTMQKSENSSFATLMKNDSQHPFVTAGPDTKLIHYSGTQNLKEIDPFHHGSRGIGEEAEQGKPAHPMGFFYLEGTKPEHTVTSGAKSKYVARLSHMKLYDVGTDPDNIRQSLRDAAKDRPINPGIYTREDLDGAIKEKGYHGIYNSTLNETMSNVAGIYHKVPVEKEMAFHPKDADLATGHDHHGEKQHMSSAKQFAKENGHHDGAFLHNLSNKFGKE